MKTIEVSPNIYAKLEQLAKGFSDTPNQVIERLINNSNIVKNTVKNSNKDYTKYIFNEIEYGKNRLVLSVIKKFVEDNKNISFSGLETKFPKSIQGSSGVFDRFEEGSKAFTKKIRFFTKKEELIQLSDICIAVCSQWGIGNIDEFIEQAEKLGYIISEKQT